MAVHWAVQMAGGSVVLMGLMLVGPSAGQLAMILVEEMGSGMVARLVDAMDLTMVA
jgi:hypothetical protein